MSASRTRTRRRPAAAAVRFPSDVVRIASWNVNSIRRRQEAVLAWAEATRIDVLLLQETKVTDEQFPTAPFAAAGWQLAIFGEPQRNGVAILARQPIEHVARGLEGDDTDGQARYIEATVADLRLASVYVPNGTEVGSDKFAYKLAFFERLGARLDQARQNETPLLIGGDYNVAPEPLDVCDPAGWEGGICFHLDERRAWRRLVNRGFTDAFRALNPTKRAYSFWEHKGAAFKTDEGVRIDHHLLSPSLADRLQDCAIDRIPRSAKDASDHAPIWVELG
ncbi:MAG: exodeoxyribonuclease III [Geminicoccaceae bacterium]|nr:MAG: exodeoxyribonuclease III [Geminicoccaceae bacterium]